MSFSFEIKEELSKISNLAKKNLVKAEFIGYLLTENVSVENKKIKIVTENEYNINRFAKLLSNVMIENYKIEIQGKKYLITFNKIEIPDITYDNKGIKINNEIKKDENMNKALVRGAFLGAGSINEPNNNYHLEIIFSNEFNADYIKNILKIYDINVKILDRNNNFVIYIKDGEEISKFLAFIGANKGIMKFEDIRAMRDLRNNVNRIVNCETANLNKTINAAIKQINDIKYLMKIKKYDELSDSLKEIAELRLNNPEASLIELGKMLKKPIGKSGVNHRLKTISQIAEEER